MHATASSSIRCRSAAGGHRFPKMCSFRFSPVPTPRKNRPGIMASEVAAAWATSPGWILINGQVTPVPRRSPSVAWATPPITHHTKGLGEPACAKRRIELGPRTETAQEVVKSICPYCGVGCGQNVYVSDGKITDIEGDPDSPVSRGRLCPKGAATFQLVTGSHRVHSVLYRRPRGTKWEEIPLDQAMDMVAERVKKARDENW